MGLVNWSSLLQSVCNFSCLSNHQLKVNLYVCFYFFNFIFESFFFHIEKNTSYPTSHVRTFTLLIGLSKNRRKKNMHNKKKVVKIFDIIPDIKNIMHFVQSRSDLDSFSI